MVSFTNTPIPKYTITATAGENGTITPASADVEEGASADFTITANSGYVIESLTVDSAAVAEAADKGTHVYTFDNVTAAHTIAATFEVAAGQEKVSDVVITGSGVTLAKDPVFVASDNELVSTFDRYTGGSAELSLINDDGTASSVTFTKEEGGFVCAVTLDVSHTDDAAAVTLSLSPVSGSSFDSAKNYFAMIQKKDKSGYSIFACKHADSRLEVTVKPVGDYFTENTIAVYAGTTAATGGDTPTSDGGGSGGGCAAGIGVLALLALIPLALRRKR
ncbi:MAG: Synerg-CTERM sorting domain-containing protein [Synergistaceae bacterium]|nr:Synerg-CTERM sorting domain-containing protein [Synergistaceae bacterium]